MTTLTNVISGMFS